MARSAKGSHTCTSGSGRAYVYLGAVGGLAAAPAFTLTGGSQFGASVGPAGDVDHDGYADVIVGAPGSGEAYVFRGGPAGLITTPHIVLSEPPAAGLFGCSVYTAGDVNGDGYSDVIVGARLASVARATEAMRAKSESAREVSTMGTLAPSTRPAHSPPPTYTKLL